MVWNLGNCRVQTKLFLWAFGWDHTKSL